MSKWGKYGFELEPGRAVHITVNTGHFRFSRHVGLSADRLLQAEHLLRVTLAGGPMEMDGSLSVFRMEAAESDGACKVMVLDGRVPIGEFGLFPAGCGGDDLWRQMLRDREGLARDLARPAGNVVLTKLLPGLVHHGRHSVALDHHETLVAWSWFSIWHEIVIERGDNQAIRQMG